MRSVLVNSIIFISTRPHHRRFAATIVAEWSSDSFRVDDFVGFTLVSPERGTTPIAGEFERLSGCETALRHGFETARRVIDGFGTAIVGIDSGTGDAV